MAESKRKNHTHTIENTAFDLVKNIYLNQIDGQLYAMNIAEDMRNTFKMFLQLTNPDISEETASAAAEPIPNLHNLVIKPTDINIEHALVGCKVVLTKIRNAVEHVVLEE